MHCSVRTDVVVQYIHTYIHTYVRLIALDCASYHTSTLGESEIRLHSPYRSREKSGRDDIMHYAQNLDIQQRSLYSIEHTLPKTKTTYIHDTSWRRIQQRKNALNGASLATRATKTTSVTTITQDLMQQTAAPQPSTPPTEAAKPQRLPIVP